MSEVRGANKTRPAAGWRRAAASAAYVADAQFVAGAAERTTTQEAATHYSSYYDCEPASPAKVLHKVSVLNQTS